MTPSKILIGIPGTDHWLADFCVAFTGMTMRTGAAGIQHNVLNVRSTNWLQNRHRLARHAQNGGYTHLMFLDHDMTFPTDALIRLLGHDRDIVGAVYPKRAPPHTIVGEPLGAWQFAGLTEMDFIGFGVSLLKVEAFADLSSPLFTIDWNPDTDEWSSEDAPFCRRVRAAGRSVWADMDLSREVTHIGQEHYVMQIPAPLTEAA